MARIANPIFVLLGQRGHLFPWVPVFLALGIGIYFGLKVEPNTGIYASLALICVVLGAGALWLDLHLRPLLLGALLIVLGVLVAGTRAHMVSAPMLKFRYYGPIEGRIVKIDRSFSDKQRLTLDRVILERTSASRTPTRIRISLHAENEFMTYEPGMTVVLTGHLSAPQGPVEPDGFDFQRMAWFQSLGGVGYTRSPVLLLETADAGGTGLFIHRLRARISTGVQAELPTETGAFAAALMTGDRSGMSRKVLADLRASNLAHLLAISGLHMGLLTAFVFGALRLFLSSIPRINQRWPVKKIAASLSLIAAAGYLALSGGNIATERAFIMVAVMLGAVLLDRRALSLRAVALAAIIVLLRRPEALTGPGFQMSFAATTALVAVFGWMRNWQWGGVPQALRPVVRPVATVFISSFVAGMATAPVAAAHFNQIAHYGLLANVLTVPLMGVLVMPAAVLTAVLYPLGLAWVGLEIMHWGLLWILGVADWVAGLNGALSHVVTPMVWAMPLFAVGMLFLMLWQGRARFIGVVVALVGLGLWAQTVRPDLLISGNGKLVGVMGAEGRALNKNRGDGFSARSWLENDGDGGVAQAQAFARIGLEGGKYTQRFDVGGQAFVHLRGKRAQNQLADLCTSDVWLITDHDSGQDGPCTLIDAASLGRTGALAIYGNGPDLRIVSATQRAGLRLWNRP